MARIEISREVAFYRCMLMRKAEIAIIEKIFTAEIAGSLPCQLRDSKSLRLLVADDCVEEVSVKLGGTFPMTIRGYVLTQRGRILYCESVNKKPTTKRAFRNLCIEAGQEYGVEVSFYDDESPPDAFEDDGALHVRLRGIRACFAVGYADGKTQNKLTKDILLRLGMDASIGERTLVAESDEE